MSKWKFNHPTGTNSCLGEMSFINEDRIYKIGGRTYTGIREVVDEYNLLMEVYHDHDWAHPVVTRINERANALKQNLMDLHNNKEPKDGRTIQHTKDAKTPDTSGGGSPADDDRQRGRAETKKTQRQKRNDTDG